MKTKLYISAIAIAVMFAAAACSSSSPEQSAAQTQLDQTPSWILSPPMDTSEYLYSTATATGSRQNVARSRAENAAKQALSGKLGEKVEALQKLFEEEVSDGQNDMYSAAFTNASQIITSQELVGASIDELRFFTTPQGGFTAHVLMRMPVGDARSQLDNALSRDEELYIRFKESQAFEELQNNLERLGLD